MFCSSCGNQIAAGSRFCSSCGAAVSAPEGFGGAAEGFGASGSAYGSAPPRVVGGRLVRPRSPRAIAGVCSGIALYYGWDVTLVRIVTAVVSLFWGFGVLLYVAAWIVIPEAPYALPRSV